jgi:hypothetical protein
MQHCGMPPPLKNRNRADADRRRERDRLEAGTWHAESAGNTDWHSECDAVGLDGDFLPMFYTHGLRQRVSSIARLLSHRRDRSYDDGYRHNH